MAWKRTTRPKATPIPARASTSHAGTSPVGAGSDGSPVGLHGSGRQMGPTVYATTASRAAATRSAPASEVER
jgi:hypothetical protein